MWSCRRWTRRAWTKLKGFYGEALGWSFEDWQPTYADCDRQGWRLGSGGVAGSSDGRAAGDS